MSKYTFTLQFIVNTDEYLGTTALTVEDIANALKNHGYYAELVMDANDKNKSSLYVIKPELSFGGVEDER